MVAIAAMIERVDAGDVAVLDVGENDAWRHAGLVGQLFAQTAVFFEQTFILRDAGGLLRGGHQARELDGRARFQRIHACGYAAIEPCQDHPGLRDATVLPGPKTGARPDTKIRRAF